MEGKGRRDVKRKTMLSDKTTLGRVGGGVGAYKSQDAG